MLFAMGKDSLATLDKSVRNEVSHEFFKSTNIIIEGIHFFLVFQKNISAKQSRSIAMMQHIAVDKVAHF